MFDLSEDAKKNLLAELVNCPGFGKTRDGKPSVAFDRITIEAGNMPGLFGGPAVKICLYHGLSMVAQKQVENCNLRAGDVLNISGLDGLMPISLGSV